ncbi:MAG: hypothetical protein OXU77_19615, partial [Gammaproteobacteria bacterium]|nr:hypothetical protein [Gammaproteobacteria bacterium]
MFEGEAVTYTMRLLEQPVTPVTVTISTTNPPNPALQWLDRTSLTFTTSNWGTAQTVTISVPEDDIHSDLAETYFILGHRSSPDVGGGSILYVLPTDNEAPAQVEIQEGRLSVTEGGSGSIGVRLSAPPGGTVTVNSDWHRDSRQAGEGRVTIDPVSLEFTDSNWRITQPVSVMVAEDDDELDESVWMQFFIGSDLNSSFDSVEIRTVDNDVEIDPGLLVPSSTHVAEGSTANYGVRLATRPSGAVTVTITGTAGTDLALDRTSLTFNPTGTNLWSTPQTVTITAGEDVDVTNDVATLRHTASGGDYAGLTADLLVTTVETPRDIALTVDADTGADGVQDSLAEDGGGKPVRVTATIIGAARFTTDSAITIKVGKSGDTATEGTDYANVADQTITIPAGAASAHVDFTLAPVDDDVAEGDETISIEGELTGLAFANTSVTIADDDMAELSIDDVTAAEGAAATFTISLSTPSTRAVTVTATTSEGTATDPEDYTHKTETLTIAAGDTTADFSVAIQGDSINELDETFTVTLSGASGASIADGAGTGTISGVDTLIAIADASAREGQNLSFTLTRSGDTTAGSSVTWTTGDDTAANARKATAAADYTAVTQAQTLSFAATETTRTITVAALADDLVEGDETFRVNLASPSGAALASAFATGAVTEGTTGYEVGDASAAEGDSLTFVVTRSGLVTGASTVSWTTAADTTKDAHQAAAGDDYTAVTQARTLNFAANATSRTFTVSSIEDTLDEPDETLAVKLAAPSNNGTLLDDTGIGAIEDDDATTVTLTTPDASATE